MRKEEDVRYVRLFMAVILLGMTCTGCLSGLREIRGKSAFDSLQAAVSRVKLDTAPSVVHVKLKDLKAADNKMAAMARFGMGGKSDSSRTMQGIILTEAGHILIPVEAKPDEVGRIEVLVGDTEYSAKVVKVDDKLNMTIIKIEPEEKLVPLDIDQAVDIDTGAWCIVVEKTDENAEYAVLSTLNACSGQLDDRYRMLILTQIPRTGNGAPVMSVSDGKVAGLLQNRRVLAMSDLRMDLQDLLADATQVVSADEEDEKGKSWLGIMQETVNREYAKSHGLPKSAVWVASVVSDSPAAEAGLREGDLIVGFNGKPLRLSGERVQGYFRKTMRPKTGNPFTLSIVRDGKERVLEGKFTKKPDEESMRAEDIGVTVSSITDTEYFSNGIFTRKGVIVTDILKGSPAATSSSFRRTLLSKNDVIVELAGRPTPTLAAFSDALEYIRREKLKVILVTYWRGRSTGYAGLNLEKNENGKGDK